MFATASRNEDVGGKLRPTKQSCGYAKRGRAAFMFGDPPRSGFDGAGRASRLQLVS